MPKIYFPRIAEAREALKAKALELYELQVKIIQEAIAIGDLETASKANQWLIEHMPEQDGVRMIDVSIDKPKEETKGQSTINIGFRLGGMSEPVARPAAKVEIDIIDVDPEKSTKH